MNSINSQRLEYLKNIARELRIAPLYERFFELLNSGEIEKANTSAQELVIDLLEYVKTSRLDNRTAKALKALELHNPGASIDNILWNIGRTGISKHEMVELNTCNWIRSRRSIIMVGPTGVGKTRLCDCLAVSAVTSGFKVFYKRAPMLVAELKIAVTTNGMHSYLDMIKSYDLIYIDDFCTGCLSLEAEGMLAEIADCLAGKVSFLITSQHDASSWISNYFITQGVGESFADRIYRPALRFVLEGPSLRDRKFNELTQADGTNDGTTVHGTAIHITQKENEKRRRGRPPKENTLSKSDAISEHSTNKDDVNNHTVQENADSESGTTKYQIKRRGRPPKNIQSADNSIYSQPDTVDGTYGTYGTVPSSGTNGTVPKVPSKKSEKGGIK